MRNKAISKGQFSALALILALTGCTALSDCKYEVGQKIRTKQAWCEFNSCHQQYFTRDYSSGWKAGFYDVATGGSGCPPVIAPKKYWKPPVFVEYDPSRRDDWYCGFQDGAAYAKTQPDHHYLKVFLSPRKSCPVQTDLHPQVQGEPVDFPMEHLQMAPGEPDDVIQILPPVQGSAPAAVDPAVPSQPEVQEPPEGPAPTPTNNYEEDPASAVLQPVPVTHTTLRQLLVQRYQEQLREQAGADRVSLLQQLVLNAARPSAASDY